MQIQLKQREIEAALKMFISQQGISLAGKTVEVEFTSGRKDNGLSAELTIEDTVGVGAVPAVTPTEETPTDDPVAKPASLFTK